MLQASRNLRQNVLKGRIWGFGEDGDKSPEPTKSRFISRDGDDNRKARYSDAITTDPESLYESAGSSSSVDLSRSLTDSKETTPRSRISGRFRNGRVKGMVKTWEVRSGSESGSASESSEVEEDNVDEAAPEGHGSSMSTVKRILPAPPIVKDFVMSNAAAAMEAFGTVTPNTTGGSHSPSGRMLPAPPVNLLNGTVSSARSMPLTPPLHRLAPDVEEEEMSMDDLLRMNGIQPELTRKGKRKAQRAKALHGYTEDMEVAEGPGVGVEAWLAGDDVAGVTVKRIVDEGSGSRGKNKKETPALQSLNEIFEAAPNVAPHIEDSVALEPSQEEATMSAEAELAVLRQTLVETQEVAQKLADRVEEYEGRVVRMDVLRDEILLDERQKKDKEGSVDSGVALSSVATTDLEDDSESRKDQVVEDLRNLREENEVLRTRLAQLESQQQQKEQPKTDSQVAVNDVPLAKRVVG